MKNIFKNQNIVSSLFFIIPIGIIINMFLSWKEIIYYTPDSYSYIGLSKSLPDIKYSLFPIFLPVLLRIFSFFTKDYDIAFKVINLLSVIFIILFVRVKNFYWKEIWVIMTFSSFQNIFPMAWTENLFFSFLIAYCYYNFKFLNREINKNQFLFYNSFLLIIMCLLKYNAMFIIIGSIISGFLIRKKDYFFSKYCFFSTIISGTLFSVYLVFNFFQTGSITGNRDLPNNFGYINYFINSVRNVPLTYDPVAFSLQRIAVKIKLEYGFKYITILPYITSYLISFFSIRYLIKLKNIKIDAFSFFCIISSINFLVFTFITGFNTKIDVLDFRLLLSFYVFLLIGIINTLKNNIKVKYFDNKLFLLGIVSLIIFTISLVI